MKFLSSEKLSPNKYRTTEGYLICKDAILARTGKQQYRRSEIYGDSCENADDIVDVDRSEKEVFSDATLASFENKPITVEHPDESVNSTNWKNYQVGFVRDVRRGKTQDGQDVILGNLIIQDEKAIEEILNGEHTDLSCGYDCDIKDDNGLYQTNIRGNHVALCREGRAGIAKIVDSKMKDSSWIGQFSKLDMLGINTESKEALDNFVKKLASKYNLQGKVFKYKNQNGYPEFHFIGERKNIEELMKNEWSSRSNKETFESIIDSNMKDAKDYSWFKGYVNGDLQSYNILQLIQKVKEKQEALHTNLTGRDGNVYFVSLDPNMNADFINGKNIWIDIVKYMPDNSQKRVVSEQFSSWGECERIFNSFKMGVRDFNSLKDDGSYAIIFNKLYNGDYDSLNEVRKDFQYIKYNLTEEEKEKVLNEIANTFGESVERVRRMIGDSANAAKDSWSGVRENGVIVDGNRFNNVNELYKYLDNIKDSNTIDMGQHVPGVIVPAHQTYNPEYSIQQFKSYISNVIRDLYGNEYNGEKVRAISKLNAYVSQVIDDFKADIKNSNLDKRKTVQYYTQYVDALYKELADVTNIQNIDGQSLKKIDDIHAEMIRSIHDSKLKDSIESEVTNEIKRKYPSVIIRVSNYIATMGDGSRLYSLEYMFDNLPDNKHEWLQFLNYLNKKYNGPYYYDESKSIYSLSIYKKSGGDSIKDKESASVRSAIDLLEGRLARSQGYELYKDHIVIDGSNFSISTNVYNRLIELGYGRNALNNIKDSLDNKKNIIKIIKIIKCAKKGI